MHYLQDTDRLAWASLVRVINFYDLTTAFGDQCFAALLVDREPTEVISYSQCVKFRGSGGFAVCLCSPAIVLKSSKLSTLPIWSWCFRGTEWSHMGDSEIFVCTHNHVFRLKAAVRQSRCTGSCGNVPSPWEIVFAECKGVAGWAQMKERYGAGWLSYLPSLLILNVASKLFVNIVTRMNSRSPV